MAALLVMCISALARWKPKEKALTTASFFDTTMWTTGVLEELLTILQHR